MKQKQPKNLHQAGFTLLELMAVISIMAVLTVAVVVDFNRQKAVRSLVLSKNETVTNIRKVQSYMLSSRNIAPNVSAKFYIAEFERGASTYKIQAVDNQYRFYSNVQTVKLPTGVTFRTLSSLADTAIENDNPYKEGDGALDPKGDGGGGFGIGGDGGGGEVQIGKDGDDKGGGEPDRRVIGPLTDYECIQVIFSAPFGTMYVYGAASCGSGITAILRDPVQLAALSQRTSYLFLDGTGNNDDDNYILLNPLTGQISAN